jgi:hypothetical protein
MPRNVLVRWCVRALIGVGIICSLTACEDSKITLHGDECSKVNQPVTDYNACLALCLTLRKSGVPIPEGDIDDKGDYSYLEEPLYNCRKTYENELDNRSDCLCCVVYAEVSPKDEQLCQEHLDMVTNILNQ